MINIGAAYPTKTAGATSAYPLGSARNVTTPGDGTGTPWAANVLNDWLGFQQAAIGDAGITPSGAPDTATASQMLEALKDIMKLDPVVNPIGTAFGVYEDGVLIASGDSVDGLALGPTLSVSSTSSYSVPYIRPGAIPQNMGVAISVGMSPGTEIVPFAAGFRNVSNSIRFTTYDTSILSSFGTAAAVNIITVTLTYDRSGIV